MEEYDRPIRIHFHRDALVNAGPSGRGLCMHRDKIISPPRTFANDINNVGQIVGFTQETGCCTGYLYEGGSFTRIISGGYIFTNPRGINDAGDIVGDFRIIPEPNAVVFISFGLCLFVAYVRARWHQKRCCQVRAYSSNQYSPVDPAVKD